MCLLFWTCFCYFSFLTLFILVFSFSLFKIVILLLLCSFFLVSTIPLELMTFYFGCCFFMRSCILFLNTIFTVTFISLLFVSFLTYIFDSKSININFFFFCWMLRMWFLNIILLFFWWYCLQSRQMQEKIISVLSFAVFFMIFFLFFLFHSVSPSFTSHKNLQPLDLL